ncbi:MAG TPA: serine/threonine protein phosphatase [Bacteroidales bacterium]|nr:serine/threonine protein phosphatase [Bacteroidales bacterium]
MTQKRWVIPDIHGYSKTLEALIDQIRPSKTDHLIFLGDYIDRGPNSKGVLDYLMSLKEKGQKMNCLLGNHEEFLLNSLAYSKSSKGIFNRFSKNKIKNDWLEFGGKETLKSFGTRNIERIPQKYIDWMSKLEYYLEFKDYVLVHAGLNFKNEDIFADKLALLWSKEFEIIPSKIGYRQLIHGHTPVDLEYIHHCINTENHLFIDLDNGVYMTKKAGFGNLMAFELNSRLLLTQYNVDE